MSKSKSEWGKRGFRENIKSVSNCESKCQATRAINLKSFPSHKSYDKQSVKHKIGVRASRSERPQANLTGKVTD